MYMQKVFTKQSAMYIYIYFLYSFPFLYIYILCFIFLRPYINQVKVLVELLLSNLIEALSASRGGGKDDCGSVTAILKDHNGSEYVSLNTIRVCCTSMKETIVQHVRDNKNSCVWCVVSNWNSYFKQTSIMPKSSEMNAILLMNFRKRYILFARHLDDLKFSRSTHFPVCSYCVVIDDQPGYLLCINHRFSSCKIHSDALLKTPQLCK